MEKNDNFLDEVPSLGSNVIDDLFLHVLLTSNIDRDDIIEYLQSQGLEEAEIERLFNDQIIYTAEIDNYDDLTNDLLIKSLKDKNYNLSFRILDMINKRDGKYNQNIDIRSNNEPIKIQFSS